jgi:hypothetical protein
MRALFLALFLALTMCTPALAADVYVMEYKDPSKLQVIGHKMKVIAKKIVMLPVYVISGAVEGFQVWVLIGGHEDEL